MAKPEEIAQYRDVCKKFVDNVIYENAWDVLRAASYMRHEHLNRRDWNILSEAAEIAVNESNYYD